MKKLYDLRKMLCAELEECASKKLDAATLDLVDKLAHATKNLDKIIERCEMEESGYSNYSYGHMTVPPVRVSYYDPGISMAGYSQGRGPYAKRDSLGRYASSSGNFAADLQTLANEAPNEAIRQKLMVMMNDM